MEKGGNDIFFVCECMWLINLRYVLKFKYIIIWYLFKFCYIFINLNCVCKL